MNIKTIIINAFILISITKLITNKTFNKKAPKS